MTILWLGMLRFTVRNGATSVFSVYKNSRIQIYYNEKFVIITHKVFLYILANIYIELHMTKTEKDVFELDLQYILYHICWSASKP